MPEQYSNNYASTLSGGYTSGSGSMSVSSASGLPTVNSGDTTHLTVFDASTGAFKLLVRVTAVSGTTLTVVAETSDTNCSSGDKIRGSMISVEALDNLRKDLSQAAVFASLPSTTGQKEGNVCRQKNGPYEFRMESGVWVPYLPGFGQVTLPPSGGWSSEGVTRTIDYTYGYGYMATGVSNALTMQYRAVPGSTPWTVRAVFGHDLGELTYGTAANGTSNHGYVLGVRDSGGKWISFFFDINMASGALSVYLGVFKHSAYNAAGATYYAINSIVGLASIRNPSMPMFINNDGTNLTFSTSADFGNHKDQITQHGITDYLADVSYIGWGSYTIVSNNAEPTVLLLDWTVS